MSNAPNPYLSDLRRLMAEKNIHTRIVRAALGCSSQRASSIARGRTEPTVGEYMRLLLLVGKQPILPSLMPNTVEPDHAITRGNTPPVVKFTPYKRVAGDNQIMLAIAKARVELMRSMPRIATAPMQVRPDDNANKAWMRAAALSLWNACIAHGNDPRAALTEFCARMSTAVLKSTLYTLGDRNEHAVKRHCEEHRDALTTPYDMIVRFIPDEQETLTLLTASQVFERYLIERHAAQTGESNG